LRPFSNPKRKTETMKNLSLLACALISATSLFAAAPTHVSAQSSEYNRQLDVQLREARSLYLPAGQSIVRGPLGGSLSVGGTVNYSFQFVAGRSYTILGVCDNDCSDLDITLYDPAGNQVAEDVLTDDKPVASITARRSGRYRATVSMASCSTEPCFYAVAAYGSAGGRNSAKPR
jgi:hypothetical protein